MHDYTSYIDNKMCMVNLKAWIGQHSVTINMRNNNSEAQKKKKRRQHNTKHRAYPGYMLRAYVAQIIFNTCRKAE